MIVLSAERVSVTLGMIGLLLDTIAINIDILISEGMWIGISQTEISHRRNHQLQSLARQDFLLVTVGLRETGCVLAEVVRDM